MKKLGLSVLLSCFALMAFAQEGVVPVIRVTGSAQVSVVPDTATLTFGVVNQAPTAQQAAAQNAKTLAAVLGTMQKRMAGKGQLQTGRYQLNPRYEYDQTTRKSQLVGYEASNQVILETAADAPLGDYIDAAVQAGSNQVDSLQFSRKDMQAVTQQALQVAIKQAKATAAEMASGAGVGLGSVLEISTGALPGPQPLYKEMRLMAGAADSAPATAILPGELVVGQQVSMVFAIK